MCIIKFLYYSLKFKNKKDDKKNFITLGAVFSKFILKIKFMIKVKKKNIKI